MSSGVVHIKDAFGNVKILQTVGAGTASDPFRMVNANNLSETIQGNIPGKTTQFITGNNPNIGNSFVNMTDFSGTAVFPSSAESLEIVSDNTNDTALGTGMRTVIVTTLLADYSQKINVISMNGTNAVPIPETHIAVRSLTAFTADPTGIRSNIGTITLRVVGGGIRLQMQPTEGNSFSGVLTVPLGKLFIPTTVAFFVQKGEDVIIRPRFLGAHTNAAFVSSGPAPLYQSSTFVTIMATAPIPEKASIFFEAKSTNLGVNATVVLEGDLIDV